MRYPIAVLFLFLGLSACQPNESADQGNAQIVAAAEAAAQAAQAAAQAAEVASRNAEAAAQAAETAGSTAQAAAAPAQTAAPAEAAAPAEGDDGAAGDAAATEGGEAASVPAGGDGQNAAAEGDEAQNAAPADGGDSPQAEGAAAGGEEAAAPAEGGEAAAGDPAAGQALFTGALGCAGCHGQDGGGGMGPALNDAEWIYGGDQAAITETLVNGRPGGMPAFGGQASEEDIANVVAFVMSLGGATGGDAAAPAEGGAEAEAAAPAEGGDAHAATGTPEQQAAAAAGPIEGAQPPDNTPVTGADAGSTSLDYNTAEVGQGEGYTHPNGMGADWADDGQAEPIEGPAPEANAEGDEAQNAAPEDGGDSPQAEGDAHAATGTEEQQAAAATGPIEGSQPPDNTPVAGGEGGGATLDYNTANVGQGEGYTHPNGIGSDWADDGQAEPVEGAPAGSGEEAPAEGGDGAAASGGDAAAPAEEGDAAAPAAAEEGDAAAAGGGAPGDAAAGEALFTGKLGCYGCHGRAGGGGMGPSLADKNWIYGGDYAALSETLHNGRPGGMPAFGGQASDQEIDDVIAYIISLGGTPAGAAAAPAEGGAEAEAAAPAEGGDAHAATGTPEQQAAAAAGPIEGAQPPDNTPVTGADAGGAALDYATANVGTGAGYTHPNGIGSDWADDGQAEPVEGPEAEAPAAPAEGDAHAATGTEEQQAAAASAPIEQADPPDNTPVAGGEGGGATLDYNTANVGQGEGYTHPNGIGSDWADDGQAEPVEGAPAEGDDSAAAPAEGGDAHDVNASEEELAAAAAAPIEQADPPDNTPVASADAGSTSLDYNTAEVGRGAGYTHPNGIGADWVADGTAEPVEGPAPEGEAAAPTEGDAHAATGTEEQQAAAATGPIEGSQPPDNTPVAGGEGGGATLDYNTAQVGTGEGYTHPNGMGGDWAADNQSTN